jgi:hypothetical protein
MSCCSRGVVNRSDDVDRLAGEEEASRRNCTGREQTQCTRSHEHSMRFVLNSGNKQKLMYIELCGTRSLSSKKLADDPRVLHRHPLGELQQQKGNSDTGNRTRALSALGSELLW